MENLSEMFAAIVSWASEVKGAENVGKEGKLWIETTEPNKFFDAAVKVEMNATTGEIDDIPAFTARLTNEVYFPGIMALVSPYGGTLIGAGDGDEERLINHFNAQPRPSSPELIAAAFA